MTIDWGLLLAPWLAGALVTATHVPLGRKVLERGIIFIDLAIAQVAAFGLVLATRWGLPDHGLAMQVSAVVCAVLAAAVLAWTERRFPEIQEALIGCLYVVSACAAVLLLAGQPHGAEQLQELLAGQILWVNASALWPTAILYAVLLPLWALWARHRPAAFYFLFAVAVVASVQLVGVFLVFATLILPALAVQGWAGPRALVAAYAISIGGYTLGLALSSVVDLPSGPLVVCTLALLAGFCGALRWFHGRRMY